MAPAGEHNEDALEFPRLIKSQRLEKSEIRLHFREHLKAAGTSRLTVVSDAKIKHGAR
jgi:hypothetical protein